MRATGNRREILKASVAGAAALVFRPGLDEAASPPSGPAQTAIPRWRGFSRSGRSDSEYEDWQGHKLDRGLLKLLQKN